MVREPSRRALGRADGSRGIPECPASRPGGPREEAAGTGGAARARRHHGRRVPRATCRSEVTETRRLLLPLALAQFICSFAGSNMNVMINDISTDLNTSVKGVQTTITLFLLVM